MELRSYHAFGSEQFARVWQAVHRRGLPDAARRVFAHFIAEDVEITSWPSFIGDDHTPYEFSLLLGGTEPEVRLMAEILPCRNNIELVDTITSGRKVLSNLAKDFDIELSRFDAISDLFLPDDARGAFALWLAATFDPAGTPHFKLYFNPCIQGAERSPQLVEEMFRRLGFPGAWDSVCRARWDDLRFVSLDLNRSESARIKVYSFYHHATVDDLVRAAKVAPGADLHRVAAFCRTIAGGDNLAGARAPAACFAFAGGEALPRTVTIHVPVRVLVKNDAEAHPRVLRAIAETGIDADPYERALHALSEGPLEASRGRIAWAGIRTGGASPRINVYLAPRIVADYGPASKAGHSSGRIELTPEAIVRRSEQEPITAHPLLQRIAHEPLDMDLLTLVMYNVGEAIPRDFARRLASITARVEEDAIRSVLAKQLNDEMGNGDPKRAHKLLFEEFLIGLAPWVRNGTPDWHGPDARWLEPGRVLGKVQEELFVRRDPYEGLGAALVMEVYGKHFDTFINAQLRRKRESLSKSVLEWLNLHEELEVEHVDESYVLARQIPNGPKSRSAVRGAEEAARAAWAFLDAVQRIA
ncbi:tryptophan dimethylallyltransferase family protein [Pendulispora albinea]|uniref:Iron-containing redox enzyme family protein n=1 Tax=Pendulispora albinea TaxID=2741071 RepID=A0ABZ2LW05_9BACT